VRLQDHPGVARLNGRYTSYTDSGHIGITTVFEDEFYIWVPPNSGFEGNAGTASADYGLRVVRLKVRLTGPSLANPPRTTDPLSTFI
jgi:hypothetical protein